MALVIGKMLLPWKLSYSGYTCDEYSRYTINGQRENTFSIAFSSKTFSSLEEAKFEADRALIENGYTLISEEQAKKIEVLL